MSPADTSKDEVILVDEHDAELGVAPKLEVHRDGRLHRAVSVVLFDDSGHVLLQRRASTKYHSAGLWSNTCCGHPLPTESTIDAGTRRLRAEMGIEACALALAGRFIYRARLDNGLVEHELDHVLVGVWAGSPLPDAREVSAWQWMPLDQLTTDVEKHPRSYTAWLKQTLAIASPSRPG
jgi:isopentenyl-diphosphate delta-isomerase